MVQTLTRLGDKLALEIDRSVLEQLHIDADTRLSVTVVGNCLMVAPAGADDRRKRFNDAKRDTFEKYDDVFRRLAE